MNSIETKPIKFSPVDPAWYLTEYPDVAAAGIDPQQHYDDSGHHEGRFPRAFSAYRLEKALWGGFALRAVTELDDLWSSTRDQDERIYAAWSLARWFASDSQWKVALRYVSDLSLDCPPYIGRFGPTLLKIEILIRNGERALAAACINEAIAAHGLTPDLCLLAANAGLSITPQQPNQSKPIKLTWLNHVFSIGGLSPIIQRDPNNELSLDSLASTEPVKELSNSLPKISIIMPAFNAEAYIETALRSLIQQSWTNLEIIVVDDHSTDSTAARVKAMAQQDNRIILLELPENNGPYAARNVALKKASGELIANHDSDDWSHPLRLEIMAKPLLEDPNLVATLADWVRADNELHFQRWRMEDSLIEPSVSTIMVRRDAVRALGGWDEVRVAADHELRQRLLKCHGNDAVLHVKSGIPLVIARHLPESLTMASGTHLRSTFFGLRQLYSSLADTWHEMTDDAAGLRLPVDAEARAFPAPAPMLRTTPSPACYDWLLISDLSETARTAKALRVILERLQEHGKNVALLHWPEYLRPSPIDKAILRKVVKGAVDIVLPEQRLATPQVLVVGQHLLAYPLDQVPVIHGLKSCGVLDSVREARMLPIAPAICKLAPNEDHAPAPQQDFAMDAAHQIDMAEPAALNTAPLQDSCSIIPSLFNEAWYLQRYPDVGKAGIAPWEHYVAHGFAEGREPGPDFNTAWYLEQCIEARDSDLPALVHYEQVGRKAGYNPGHPTFSGNQQHRPGRPTVLLCAHAADVQLFGAERSLLDVLDACNALQLNVLVSVPGVANMAYIDELRARALCVACIPTQPWSANSAPCSLAVERFCALIREHSVELVQANTLMLREPLIAARIEKVPAVLHAHESPAHDPALCASIGLPPEQIVEQALERADHVLANSAFTAQHLAKPGATHVVSNIIDLKAFDLPNVIDNKRITAALISSNLPKKGIQDLLQLACDTIKDTPNLQLLLIGPHTPSVAALRTLEARGQLPANFNMLPYTTSPQAAITQANIVLNLSHCQETFGRTLLEGMAASRPVLAYRWGALPELVDEGVNGHTFEQGDTKAIANRLRQLCRNPKKIRTLGAAGRKRAKQYNLKRLCRQLSEAYTSILDYPLQLPTSNSQLQREELT